MHALWIVIAANSGILALAFLFGAWATLIEPDDEQLSKFKQRLEDARKRGWIQAQLSAFGMRYALLDALRIADHWRIRRSARNLFYFGVLFLGVALIAL